MIYKTKPVNEKVIEHRRRVRSVFRSEEGQKVLFNLFHDMGLFRVIHEPEELAMRNQAIMVATELGLLDENRVRLFLKQFLESEIETLEKEDWAKYQESQPEFSTDDGNIPSIE